MRQPLLPPPLHQLLHQRGGGGVDGGRDGWENACECECELLEGEDDDLSIEGVEKGGEEQERAREGGDESNDVQVRETSVDGGRRVKGREGRAQGGIVRMGRRGRTMRERAVASVVEQMRVRVVEVWEEV